jgi:serine/threonine-protein kinase
MAEVLLGRLRGPHGFERPIVIKRMLPHLAADPRIVDLFLDEARLIAKLRHPNLVDVYELEREGAELFLAMEFLEGESVAGLCRRLALRDEHLDVDLAAHIGAEACAGLHAAHEAKSVDGRPLGIVHRDVSPQNIFITYAGAVHVIDFGIAITADRMKRTEPGVVRGKFEYLAPEQLRGGEVDRRADIFSLGVVVLEAASGHRIYKRAAPADSLMAILSEPVPKLRATRPDAPAELEAILCRALAKEPGARFATALEMRRELLAFTRKRTDADLGEKLGRLMRDVFGDRIEEKSDMLRRVREGDLVRSLPPAEADVTVELPTAARPKADAPPRGRRLGLLVASALLAVAIAAGVFASRRPAAKAAPQPVAEPAPTPAPSASVAPAPRDVRLRVDAKPAATVFLAGTARGTTPLELSVARGAAPLALEVRAPGFVTARREVIPDSDTTITLDLAPARAPRPPAARGSATAGPTLW